MCGSIAPVLSKIARAKAHAVELEAHILRTYGRKRNFPSIGIKADPHTREGILYISRMPELDLANERTALIAGDIVHNLRSALDHLVYQLAVEHTDNHLCWPHATQFPICHERGRTRRVGKKGGTIRGWGFRGDAERYLREVSAAHIARIERYQPYPRRHGVPFRYLALLRDLDNRDKHRLLVPSIVAPSTYSFPVTMLFFQIAQRMSSKRRIMPKSGPVRFALRAVPIELGAELARMRPFSPTHRGHNVKVIGHIAPTVTLGEREAAITTVRHMIDTVSAVAADFASAF